MPENTTALRVSLLPEEPIESTPEGRTLPSLAEICPLADLAYPLEHKQSRPPNKRYRISEGPVKMKSGGGKKSLRSGQIIRRMREGLNRPGRGGLDKLYGTRTILPNCWASSIRRWAAEVSRRGNTLSTTGLRRPAS